MMVGVESKEHEERAEGEGRDLVWNRICLCNEVRDECVS